MAELHRPFEAAAAAAKTLPAKPDNQTLVKLYSLYKQATVGDVQGNRPGLPDFVGRAKYDAWAAIKGKPGEAAMQQYVDLVHALGG